VVHLAGIRAQRPLLFFFSGLLLALAIGTRVTFAPLVAPFAAVLFFFPRRSGAKELLVKIGALAAGGMLGALPMLWLFAEAPARFFFDVLQFSQTNIDYREATGNPQNMTWLLKLRFLFKEVIVPNFAVCAAAVVPIAILEWQRRRVRETFPVELAFLLLLLPFLLLGSLAPSPAFKQYFGALVPFLLLLGIFSGARLEVAVRWGKPFLLAGIAVLAAAVIGVWPDYQATLAKISTPAEWTPIKRHNEALKLRDYTQGTVLTLAPLFVLEANLKIVPEFVTGPFAWRVADFIPPTKRAELGIVGEQDLETFFAHHPPAAISLGREPRWESKLVEYAQRHGYRKVSIGDEGKALWLKPEK
jgi:hypothetical protein